MFNHVNIFGTVLELNGEMPAVKKLKANGDENMTPFEMNLKDKRCVCVLVGRQGHTLSPLIQLCIFSFLMSDEATNAFFHIFHDLNLLRLYMRINKCYMSVIHSRF